MAESREVHIAVEDRPIAHILRDVARVFGFRFRIDYLSGGIPDLVVTVDEPAEEAKPEPAPESVYERARRSMTLEAYDASLTTGRAKAVMMQAALIDDALRVGEAAEKRADFTKARVKELERMRKEWASLTQTEMVDALARGRKLEEALARLIEEVREYERVPDEAHHRAMALEAEKARASIALDGGESEADDTCCCPCHQDDPCRECCERFQTEAERETK